MFGTCLRAFINSGKFGREKELEIIRNVIRHTSTSYSRHLATSAGESVVVSSSASHGTGTNTATGDDMHSDSASSKSESMLSPSGSVSVPVPVNAPSPLHLASGPSGYGHGGYGSFGSPAAGSPAEHQSNSPRLMSVPSSGHSASPPVTSSDGLRRVALGPTSRRARTHAVVVVGQPG